MYRGTEDWLGPKREAWERPLPFWVHQLGGLIIGFGSAFLIWGA